MLLPDPCVMRKGNGTSVSFAKKIRKIAAKRVLDQLDFESRNKSMFKESEIKCSLINYQCTEQQGSQNPTQQSKETVNIKDPWVENDNDFSNVDKEKK